MKKSDRAEGPAASELISNRIAELGDWRGETLARVRALILEADPQMTEEWKWMGTPVWSHHGNVCTGETYKSVVKLTFVSGASLPDPSGLFNSSLDGNTRRAIDIREGEKLNARAFKALVRAAVAANELLKRRRAEPRVKAEPRSSSGRRRIVDAEPAVRLLAGGNPQIAKGDGDGPVQSYIAAMPGWKRNTGRRIDALIEKTAPGVRKAVRWNSPFYGVDGHGWFLSFHVFAQYVKVSFFAGALLTPMPPGGTPKSGQVRWLDIREGDDFEKQLERWVKQAVKLDGWVP